MQWYFLHHLQDMSIYDEIVAEVGGKLNQVICFHRVVEMV